MSSLRNATSINLKQNTQLIIHAVLIVSVEDTVMMAVVAASLRHSVMNQTQPETKEPSFDSLEIDH